jgi:hypothetical protein
LCFRTKRLTSKSEFNHMILYTLIHIRVSNCFLYCYHQKVIDIVLKFIYRHCSKSTLVQRLKLVRGLTYLNYIQMLSAEPIKKERLLKLLLNLKSLLHQSFSYAFTACSIRARMIAFRVSIFILWSCTLEQTL